jgi:hypothetical protein
MPERSWVAGGEAGMPRRRHISGVAEGHKDGSGPENADIPWAAPEAIADILSAEYGSLSSWLIMAVYMKTDPPGTLIIGAVTE